MKYLTIKYSYAISGSGTFEDPYKSIGAERMETLALFARTIPEEGAFFRFNENLVRYADRRVEIFEGVDAFRKQFESALMGLFTEASITIYDPDAQIAEKKVSKPWWQFWR